VARPHGFARWERIPGCETVLGMGVNKEGEGEGQVGEKEEQPDPTCRQGFQGGRIVSHDHRGFVQEG